jgi:hypothetical protein
MRKPDEHEILIMPHNGTDAYISFSWILHFIPIEAIPNPVYHGLIIVKRRWSTPFRLSLSEKGHNDRPTYPKESQKK